MIARTPQNDTESGSTEYTEAVHARAAPYLVSPSVPTILGAFGAAVAYLFGAWIGFALTFQPHPVSTLWPPNALMFAALLLVPTRSWWVFILAAFPAHVGAELASGVPVVMVLCWFVSNVFEALIGASCVRHLVAGRLRLESSEHVGVFLLVAILATFLSSFLDSAFVKLVGWGGSEYWQVWRIRFFSNLLASLTFVPVIVSWSTVRLGAVRAAPLRRLVEGTVLALGLLAVTIPAFGAQRAGPDTVPALLYVPLPFLLWAAVRFGTIGISTSVLAVTFIAILSAVHGYGPFVASSPADNALSMQLFLIGISVPLLLLAAVLQERRQAEQAARQSAERLTLALDAAQMGTWDWNLADDTVTWSPESRRIFGLTETDRDIDFDFFLSRVHPDDRAGVSRAVTRAIEQSENYEREFRVVHPDGSLRWVMGKGKVLRDDKGRPLRMSGVNLDVTDRKRAERDVQEQRQQLAHLGRVAVLGELSGALAHELSQPLTAILSNVQAGQRLLGQERVDLGELGEILGDIAQDDRRAGEVIHRLRAMFRKEEATLQSVDVHGIVRDALDLAHSDLVTRHVTVTTHLASDLPKVRGDSVQLQQVLLNLIMNASEAMSANTPSDRAMLVKTACVNGVVLISVVDNGTGIPADSLEKLFEPFFTTKAQGLGLGLAICRTIVVAHGGGLSAVNNPDRGATFHLSLPPEGSNIDR